MAELVDAPASGAGTRKGVEVRVLFWAPFHFDLSQIKYLDEKTATFGPPAERRVHVAVFRFADVQRQSYP
jgi:hypothetical protein